MQSTLARFSRGWDYRNVDQSRLWFFFRESSPISAYCHKLLVSCPACFLEQDKIKSGVAHILESHPREQHARVGHPLHGGSQAQTKTGKGWATRPASNT